jgi:hypothetical protein
VEEGEEYDVEFVEAAKDAAEALESLKQALDLVTFAVERPAVLPRFETVGSGRH